MTHVMLHSSRVWSSISSADQQAVISNVLVCLFRFPGLRTGDAVHCEETSSITVLYLHRSAHCSNVRTSKAGTIDERSYRLAAVSILFQDV
jgi:hypothetical protein